MRVPLRAMRRLAPGAADWSVDGAPSELVIDCGWSVASRDGAPLLLLAKDRATRDAWVAALGLLLGDGAAQAGPRPWPSPAPRGSATAKARAATSSSAGYAASYAARGAAERAMAPSRW